MPPPTAPICASHFTLMQLLVQQMSSTVFGCVTLEQHSDEDRSQLNNGAVLSQVSVSTKWEADRHSNGDHRFPDLSCFPPSEEHGEQGHFPSCHSKQIINYYLKNLHISFPSVIHNGILISCLKNGLKSHWVVIIQLKRLLKSQLLLFIQIITCPFCNRAQHLFFEQKAAVWGVGGPHGSTNI